MELITVLEKIAFGNQAELEAAINFLEQAALHDLPNLLRQLSDILRTTAHNEVTRAQAAILLKNIIYSKDESFKQEYQEQWQQIPEEIRLYIKNNCIESLGTETKRPSQAAQCVGHIACVELPQDLWPDCINRLMVNVTSQNASEMLKESSLEAIGYICQDINPDILAPQISDHIMTALLHMLTQAANSKASSVQEDAFLAVSTLIDVLGDKFLKYMDSLKPILYVGLKNFDEHQVCQAAVGLVGDLGRNIGSKILPYCDDIMTILLEGLISPKLNKTAKPLILSTFGDIALAIGTDFKKYAEVVLNALHQASLIHTDPNDFDLIDYFNELREGCLDAYTGILQGLKGNNNTPVDLSIVHPHINNILSFLDILSKDQNINEAVVSAACGLIGDLVSCFGQQLIPFTDNMAIFNLLERGKKSKNNRARTLSNWATKEIRKLKNA